MIAPTSVRAMLPAVVIANTAVACGFPLIAYVPADYGVSPLTATLQLSVPMLVGAAASLFVDKISTVRHCRTVFAAQIAVLIVTSVLVAVHPHSIGVFWLSRVGAALAAGATVTVLQIMHLDNRADGHRTVSRIVAATPGISAALGWTIGGIVPALTSLPVLFTVVAALCAVSVIPLVAGPYRFRRMPPHPADARTAAGISVRTYGPSPLALVLAGALLSVPLLLTVSGLRNSVVVVLLSSSLVVAVCAVLLARAGWTPGDRVPAIGAMAVAFGFGFGFTSAGVLVSFTSLAAASLLTVVGVCLSHAATGMFVTVGSRRNPRPDRGRRTGESRAGQLTWVAASFALYAISSASAAIVLVANAFRGYWLGRVSVTSVAIQQDLKHRNPHVEVFGISNVVRAGGMAYGSLIVGSIAPAGSGPTAVTCGLALLGLGAAARLYQDGVTQR